MVMNSRLEELAQQTAIIHHSESNDAAALNSTDLEKFAQLIIKDCMDVCRKEWYELNNDRTELEDERLVGIRVGTKAGVIKCMNRISKHFGYSND